MQSPNKNHQNLSDHNTSEALAAKAALGQHVEHGGFMELPQGKSGKRLIKTLILAGVMAVSALNPALTPAMAHGNNAATTSGHDHDGTEMHQAEQAIAERYKGREGFQRMFDEIRNSLYEQLPWTRGNIELYNPLNDPYAEITRIESSLGIDTIYQIENQYEPGEPLSGHASRAETDDGRYICLANGWVPENPEDLTFDQIKTYARILAHEAMHCLDTEDWHQDPLSVLFDINARMANMRRAEMFADVGAQSLLLNNGAKKEGTLQLINQYDFMHPAGSPYAQRATDNLHGLTYDNPEHHLALLAQFPDDQPGLTHFRFNWQKSLDQAKAIRDAIPITEEIVAEHIATTQLLGQILKHHIEQAFTHMAPQREAVIEALDVKDENGLRNYIVYMFSYMDFSGFKSGKYDSELGPAEKFAAQQIYNARMDFNQFLAERQHILRPAARMLAAFRYLNKQTDKIRDFDQPEFTHDQAFARAWLMYKKTGSELDRKILDTIQKMPLAIQQGQPIETWPLDRWGMTDLFEQNPEFAQAVADGKIRLDDALIQTAPPEYSSDDLTAPDIPPKYKLRNDFNQVSSKKPSSHTLKKHAAQTRKPPAASSLRQG